MTTSEIALYPPAEQLSDRDWETDKRFEISTQDTLWERFLSKKPEKWKINIGGIEIVLEKKPPNWISQIAEVLSSYRWLPNNWDSYGARGTNFRCIVVAIQILARIVDEKTPKPSVVPTTQGGVQFEWHTKGIDLEIEICPTMRIFAAFEDNQQKEEWEGEITEDFSLLESIIETLASREKA